MLKLNLNPTRDFTIFLNLEMLYSEFQQFGEIVDSIVMKNPETGNSRGFGFVTFKDNVSAENAVNAGTHKIDGKIVSASSLVMYQC